MQTSTRLTVLAALAVAAGALVWLVLWSGDAPLAPGPLGDGPERDASTMASPEQAVGGAERVGAAAERASLGGAEVDPEHDPLIAAAMCGFRGRVIDHTGAAMPSLAVELVRLAPDAIFGAVSESAFTEPVEPEFLAGKALTDGGGEFEITGVRPQAFYVLFAGVGAETTQMLVIDQTPGPGEIVDLGDIQIDLAATVTGVVVDEEGQPLAGALVRAADVPGSITGMVPLERLDPEGAVIVYEGNVRAVVSLPEWAKRAFDRLPIPKTTTGLDGAFRLTGVTPGDNVVAVTAAGKLSYVQPRVPLDAGEEKDLGKIRLREGDEVWGRVVDHEGKPVPGAEIAVGQAIGVAPVAIASFAPNSDGKGEFMLAGFRGRVVGAARRSPDHPWVVSEPQPPSKLMLLQLPGAFRLTFRVTDPGGAPIETADFRLFPGAADEGMGPAAALGMFPAAELKDGVEALGEGVYQFPDLAAGSYRVEIAARGYERAVSTFDIGAHTERSVVLEPASRGTVLVVDEAGAPVRNATVYTQNNRASPIPVASGRTNAAGRHLLEGVPAGELIVIAQHPAYGWTATEAELPAEEILLEMAAPGMLRGVLTENGEVPTLGKFMVIVSREDSGRGMDAMPSIAAPDPRGEFEVRGLQPGTYNVMAMPSSRALKSIGSFMNMARQMMLFGRGESRQVSIESRLTAETEIEIRTDPALVDGPAARVTGSVFIDGQPGQNMLVTAGRGMGKAVEVDANGRFDLGMVAAGSVDLRVLDAGDDAGMFQPLWRQKLEVEAYRDQDLVIDLATGTLAGQALKADGSSPGRCMVELRGVQTKPDGTEASIRKSMSTDDAGVFRFERVPAGRYELIARNPEGRGELTGIDVAAGVANAGLQVTLERLYQVGGTVDVADLGENPRWVRVQLVAEDGSGRRSARVNRDKGTFTVTNVESGTYRAEIDAFFRREGAEERWDVDRREYTHGAVIEVQGDVEGLLLQPQLVEDRERTIEIR